MKHGNSLIFGLPNKLVSKDDTSLAIWHTPDPGQLHREIHFRSFVIRRRGPHRNSTDTEEWESARAG